MKIFGVLTEDILRAKREENFAQSKGKSVDLTREVHRKFMKLWAFCAAGEKFWATPQNGG